MALLYRRLDAVISYLTPLLSLANCHTVEFYTDCLWSNLVPKSIQEEVEISSLDELVNIFFHAVNNDSAELSISPLASFVRSSRLHHLSVDGHICLSSEQLHSYLGVQCSPCEDISDQFVSPKKRHEVRRLMGLCHALPGTHCVELGGGKGYLGEALLQSGMSSITVDSNPVALHGGVDRAKIMKRVLASAYKSEGKRHTRAHLFIDTTTDLQALVREHFPEDFENSDECQIVITGLHTCGDLGPTSLRLFAREAAAAALCNVPCCYHHLTERAERGAPRADPATPAAARDAAGFPMSRHLRGFQLGRNARMLAAHSLDKIASTRELPSISLHYRAILQVLLRKYMTNSEIAAGRLKGIAAKSQDFHEYCSRSMKKFNLNIETQENFSDIEKQYQCQFKCLVIFYLLRLCLAQVVECAILLDRLSFLYENGFDNSFLVKLFDASISPRCHAIVARR